MSDIFTDEIFLTKLKEHIRTIPFRIDQEKLQSAITEIERLNSTLALFVEKDST